MVIFRRLLSFLLCTSLAWPSGVFAKSIKINDPVGLNQTYRAAAKIEKMTAAFEHEQALLTATQFAVCMQGVYRMVPECQPMADSTKAVDAARAAEISAKGNEATAPYYAMIAARIKANQAARNSVGKDATWMGESQNQGTPTATRVRIRSDGSGRGITGGRGAVRVADDYNSVLTETYVDPNSIGPQAPWTTQQALPLNQKIDILRQKNPGSAYAQYSPTDRNSQFVARAQARSELMQKNGGREPTAGEIDSHIEKSVDREIGYQNPSDPKSDQSASENNLETAEKENTKEATEDEEGQETEQAKEDQDGEEKSQEKEQKAVVDEKAVQMALDAAQKFPQLMTSESENTNAASANEALAKRLVTSGPVAYETKNQIPSLPTKSIGGSFYEGRAVKGAGPGAAHASAATACAGLRKSGSTGSYLSCARNQGLNVPSNAESAQFQKAFEEASGYSMSAFLKHVPDQISGSEILAQATAKLISPSESASVYAEAQAQMRSVLQGDQMAARYEGGGSVAPKKSDSSSDLLGSVLKSFAENMESMMGGMNPKGKKSPNRKVASIEFAMAQASPNEVSEMREIDLFMRVHLRYQKKQLNSGM